VVNLTEHTSQAPDFSINLVDHISFSARPYFEDLDSLFYSFDQFQKHFGDRRCSFSTKRLLLGFLPVKW
jgi:hypothetical protein